MTTRPRYLDLLIRHALDSEELNKSGVHHVEVHHDDSCAHWSGGRCDCNPTIVSGKLIDRKHEAER